MKINDNGTVGEYRTMWMEGSTVCLIDQNLLPNRFSICRCEDYRKTAEAIKNMTVRGAPAIGATAAYGVAQAAITFFGRDVDALRKQVRDACNLIKSTRPTAYDLFHAVDSISEKIFSAVSVSEAKEIASDESRRYADESAEACRMIGVQGEKLIKEGSCILTHCNAGALACVDYGTALSPVRFAHYGKKNIHIYIDETRPRLQGAKLTAWEMMQEGIAHHLIVDNAAGYFMHNGEIDLVIVGADRITKNGDVYNKIGTYEKAVVAKENGVPFYVAAPTSTFDSSADPGKKTIIEERPEEEVLCINGTRLAPFGTHAKNPGFDITPKKYVTGVITEKGIIRNR